MCIFLPSSSWDAKNDDQHEAEIRAYLVVSVARARISFVLLAKVVLLACSRPAGLPANLVRLFSIS